MEADEESDQKSDMRMRVCGMSLRRMKSAIISSAGSYDESHIQSSNIAVLPLTPPLVGKGKSVWWVGRWGWVVSSAGRLTTLAYGRVGACCACNRCGMGGYVLFLFF